MENKVLVGNHKKSGSAYSKVSSKAGITWKKHYQVMNEAQELLCKADTSRTTIYDSLNCGKLARLIAYIKNGSTIALLWISCYAESVLG